MICIFCNQNNAKYKCPKCLVGYCSLDCFKSTLHKHDLKPEQSDLPPPVAESQPPAQGGGGEPLFAQIARDPIIQGMLKEKSLQFHLLTVISILNDTHDTLENKLAIMNLKLNDLRLGGIEQNMLIEEFIERVVELSTTIEAST